MSENESVEEIYLDPSIPIRSNEEKTSPEALVPDINVDPPQTNDEKVADWITQSANAEEMNQEEKEDDEVVSAILDNEPGDMTIPDNTSEKLLPDEVSIKNVTNNDTNTVDTNESTSDEHRSVLRRMYQSQRNRPKESYMHALSSQRIISRDLRRVASASTQPESTTPVVEISEPKKQCLTPQRKGIIIGFIFGGLVVAVGLAVAVVFLIERSYATITSIATTTTSLVTTTT